MKVKEGMELEHAQYIEKNSHDDYSRATVDAGTLVGLALDEGKTPEEALEKLKGHGLTGFMAGAAVQGVVHFHPRGEELQKAWNIQCGGNGEEKGTINPAIVTIKK